MNDFKLKLILSVLSGIVFSFIFILLAFVLPPEKREQVVKHKKNKIGEVSKALRKTMLD